MSWSLQLKNGDLTLGEARYGAVTGSAKLIQDLRCALLERIGTDPQHPAFGSSLDGGRLPDGTELPSLIGRKDWARVVVEVESEIRRIERNHQARQTSRIEADKFTYGRPTLTPAEILVSIDGIESIQVGDTLLVRVSLVTGGQQNYVIDIPVST